MGALIAAVLSVLQAFFQYLIPWAILYLTFALLTSIILPMITNFLSGIPLVQTFSGLAGYFINVLKLDICFNMIFSALATSTVIRFIRGAR